LGEFARANLDALRLHRFGQFSRKVDLQETILERGILNLDEIGKTETTLESAGCDPTMHVVVVLLLAFATSNGERVLFHRDADLGGLEASDRQRNTVAVFASAQDVVRGIVVLRLIAQALVHQVENAIKADA
jgi:hypothetical protein